MHCHFVRIELALLLALSMYVRPEIPNAYGKSVGWLISRYAQVRSRNTVEIPLVVLSPQCRYANHDTYKLVFVVWLISVAFSLLP